MSAKEARLAAGEAQRAATQRHLDGRLARHEAHAIALAAELDAAVARNRPSPAVAELARQLSAARRQVEAFRPSMPPVEDRSGSPLARSLRP